RRSMVMTLTFRVAPFLSRTPVDSLNAPTCVTFRLVISSQGRDGFLITHLDGLFFMPTVRRIGDLRFVVLPDDHDPPHVHVFAGGGEAKTAPGSVGWSPVTCVGKGLRSGGIETRDEGNVGATGQAAGGLASGPRPQGEKDRPWLGAGGS